MGSFVPHTDPEIDAMLEYLELGSLEALYGEIPERLKLDGPLKLAKGVSEVDTLARMSELAAANTPVGKDLVCFAGGGAYDHDLSTAARALGSRPEFVTSYTPYQPEVAQGVLQALFEFQSLVCRISGLDISNASLYDGGSALVEAVNLAASATKRQRVVLSQALNPSFREMVKTFANGTGHQIVEAPLKGTVTDLDAMDLTDAAAICIGFPNYLGEVEDLPRLRSMCDASGALMVVVYDPVSISVLRTPGELGADIAVAEGQSLGLPLSFGGPYLGLFSAKTEFTRLVPGRLVGRTVDLDHKTAYVSTLRTREQDIRREKASSNVCTNQTLMAVQASIYLSWLGKSGFRELGQRCHSATRYLAGLLTQIEGVEVLGHSYVREFPIRLPKDADQVISEMVGEGFLAGIAIGAGFEGTAVEGSLLVTATEKRTKAEIDGFVDSLRKVLGK